MRPRRRPLKRAPALLKKIQRTHKGKRIRLFFQDEARIGQKGRTVHVWWRRGERPPGLCDKRFTFAYIFAAVEPGTDNGFALVMPHATTQVMQEFLDRFAATVSDHDHVVMMLDQAGWHASGDLRVPDNITPVPLPAYSPELNPVERVWLFLKEGFLSTVSTPTTMPSSMPPARPGTGSRTRQDALSPCARSRGFQRSILRSGGIRCGALC
jgi:hypothetical protein